LPDFILPFLPQGEGRTPQSRMLRRAFCLFTLAALIALCSSAWNNRQLLHRLSFDVAHYYRIAMTDRAPKADAVAVLRQDAALLNDWSRNGEPLRYGLGLYRGERLRPAVLAAIQTYVPPPPPPPVIKQVIQGPQTVRLDSMSLFDTGRYDLKPGSTKVLVNALVGIKAKPGWLIVIAGHTDNTGDEQSNQTLSLKRAESVRDWMRDTGDVPESCFAVQGYGESRPAATNDTAQGVRLTAVSKSVWCLRPMPVGYRQPPRHRRMMTHYKMKWSKPDGNSSLSVAERRRRRGH
jgi:outer membrane protein OmpA-like peptidoglycan-associated protein